MPRSPNFTAVTQPAAQYLAQLHEAAKWADEQDRLLAEAGWVWDDETRQWTHPDRPGCSISY